MEKLAIAEPRPTLEYEHAVVRLDDLLAQELTPAVRLFGPIMRPSVALMHAPPGVGKSMLAHEIAWAVASGKSQFTRYPLPNWQFDAEPCNVLIIDGELPMDELRRRMAVLRGGRSALRLSLLANAQLFEQEQELIDISRSASRERISRLVEDGAIGLLILDNLATLTGPLYDEDGAQAQRVINEWQAGLRQSGCSVMLIHHDNKTGGQRGSSDRETICDLIIHLERRPDVGIERAEFEVQFRKARFIESQPQTFSAALRNGRWDFGDATRSMLERLVDHMEATMGDWNYKDIMQDLSISKPYVYRLYAEAVERELWESDWDRPKTRKRRQAKASIY